MTRVPSTDVLRLELADDPTGLVNLVSNPNGRLGGWGWVTPVVGSAMTGDPDAGLYYNSGPVVGSSQGFYAEDMPITGGHYAAASWRSTDDSFSPPSSGLYFRTDMQWINAAGAVISTATPGPWTNYTPGARHYYGPNVSPPTAVKVRLRFGFAKDATGTATTTAPFRLNFNQVTLATAVTSVELGTMKVNFTPDPSFEATPLSDHWTPAGPNVAATLDPSVAYDGVRSVRLTSSAIAPVRTNLVRNPNFDHGSAVGWAAGTHTAVSVVTPPSPATSGQALQMVGDGTAKTVSAVAGAARAIPATAGQVLALRASVRFGAPGGNWTTTTIVLGLQWTDASGNFLAGTLAGVKPVATLSGLSGTIDQGNWLPISGTITVPIGAAGARITVTYTTGRNIAASMGAYLDRVMAEVASTVGNYLDGDTVASGGNPAYTWTGTVGDSTSTETTRLATTTSPGVRSLEFQMRGGRDGVVSAALYVYPTAAAVEFKAELSWYDASHNPISPATTILSLGTVTPGAGWTRRSAGTTSPPAALFARVAIYPVAIGVFDTYYVDAVQVEPGTTMGPFIIGEITTAGLPYIPPADWVDILSSTHDITIRRESLNTGTMTATLVDANLDPSREPLIHPGRACRLRTFPWGGSDEEDWQALFVGTIAQAEVTYSPQTSEPKRAHITMTVVDGLARLANIPRAEGVGTVAELPYVLEGAGVPWDVNGSGNQVPTATVVAVNENTSVLDQVAIVRDTALGFAWLDRFGVLHVYPNGGDWVGVDATLDESTYSDLDVSFNTAQAINIVNLTVTRYDASTGETDDVAYGPYTDQDSVDEWGPLAADFRVQGMAEDDTTLQAYADAILTANATPIRRVNSVLVPIRKPEDITGALAMLDLENLTTVVNSATDYIEALRVTSLEHRISTTAWTMLVGFGVDGQVATPTFTPAPGNAGGLTTGQMLRPVGEVSMWYGLKSAIPAGWLPLDGSSFSGTDYPDLAALLSSTTLPNFTDRMPVGAGTKALGTAGGNATVVLSGSQLPAHQHGLGLDSGSNTTATGAAVRVTDIDDTTGGGGTHHTALTGSSGASSPVDILPPWRSLWFIIRAR